MSDLNWKKILLRVVGGIVVIYLGVVAVRVPYFWNKNKTDAQVTIIHGTKLTFTDVMGENLPPDPGAEADKTVAGIDANDNGIRDDVELAIFKEYPNSAKTRAVLLQYALALQMEAIQPIVNTETVTEVVREQDRASSCIADTLVPRNNPESSRSSTEVERIFTLTNFVEDKQSNTTERKKSQSDFLKRLGSYSSMNKVCDIDYSTLPN